MLAMKLAALIAVPVVKAQSKQSIMNTIFASYAVDTRPQLALAEASGECMENVPADNITIEFRVKQLTKIDEKEQSYALEGYLNLRWTDSRLAYNSSCGHEKLTFHDASR